MELVKVFNAIGINEVNYVRSLLEAEGIEAVVFDDAIASVAPHYLFYQGGPRVMVRDEDEDAAKEIVRNYEQTKNETQTDEGGQE